ncbi:hypothetical protein NSB25_28210 [Acetatifactor muris]|uniref:Bacillus phage SPbeta YonK domain-containing protein n=1 Tax=Acetatifactor muris TaxID=879566 RepID=A0A2K4ZQ73_9FIRM|nr:hypothetical protein [Acetatifactor muris]MCR2051103.1 hypothetical protein [Acetatifactor muris]SOY32651.1 hypothetical protein AMURIS_05416 [Acetatifactor muris]
MAKSQLTKTRVITDKVAVKGMLSDDGTVITYTDENKIEQDITIAECLKVFAGKPIDFSVSIKSEDELPEEDDE